MGQTWNSLLISSKICSKASGKKKEIPEDWKLREEQGGFWKNRGCID